ncbi:MAG: hypothetical protein V1725_01995 [archaeon]
MDTRTLFFKPGIDLSYKFYIHGSNAMESYIETNLPHYVKLEDPQQGTGERFITMTIHTPPDAPELTPGNYGILVGTRELPPSEGGTIGTRAAIQIFFLIIALSEEKNVQFSLSAPNANQNEVVNFSVKASSQTKQDIEDVFARLAVFDPQGKYLATIDTNHKRLTSTEKTTLQGRFSTTGLTPGIYTIKGNGSYDGMLSSLQTTTFRIGELDIKLVDYTKEVGMGGITKIELTVESNWNGVIDDVYGTVHIGGVDSQPERTSNVKLERFGRAVLKSYWDTTNIPAGTYAGTLSLHYAQQEKSIPLTISVVTDQQPTGKEEQPKSITFSPLLLYGIVAALIIAIAVITLIFGRKREQT